MISKETAERSQEKNTQSAYLQYKRWSFAETRQRSMKWNKNTRPTEEILDS